MLELYIDSEAKLRQLRQCPIRKYLDDFSQWLQSSGYKQRPAQLALRAAAHFGHWTSDHGVFIEDVDDALIDTFASHLPTCTCSHGFQGRDNYHAAGARRFVSYLRSVGTVPSPAVEAVPIAPLAKHFCNWMRQHRGVRGGTLANYLPLVQEFLATLGNDTLTYDASQVREFILTVCDPNCAAGARDHAIILLLARLGLRAGDVRDLLLGDSDWSQGRIRVMGKGRCES